MSKSTQSMKPIYVEIKLFATLSKYTPSDSENFKVTTGITVGDLSAHLNLPADQVKLIFINGRQQPQNTVLKEGDRIGIFPPVGGG